MAFYSLFHLPNPLKALRRKSGIRRFLEPELQKGHSKFPKRVAHNIQA